MTVTRFTKRLRPCQVGRRVNKIGLSNHFLINDFRISKSSFQNPRSQPRSQREGGEHEDTPQGASVVMVGLTLNTTSPASVG